MPQPPDPAPVPPQPPHVSAQHALARGRQTPTWAVVLSVLGMSLAAIVLLVLLAGLAVLGLVTYACSRH